MICDECAQKSILNMYSWNGWTFCSRRCKDTFIRERSKELQRNS